MAKILKLVVASYLQRTVYGMFRLQVPNKGRLLRPSRVQRLHEGSGNQDLLFDRD